VFTPEEDEMIQKALISFALAALLLAACAPAAATPDAMMDKPTETMMAETDDDMLEAEPTEAMLEPTAETMMEDESTQEMMDATEDGMHSDAATPESMDGTDDAMMDESGMMAPQSFSSKLVDVATDAEFSLADFASQVVLVENMAMWCPTCKAQQEEVKALHELLGMDAHLVTVALDIDPNEQAGDLKAYAASNQFDWIYAVAPAELSNEIGAAFGDQFLNPPSAPMFIIDAHGYVHTLPFGIKSAEDLQQALQPYLQAEM
jgi:thiol-disulfide isomerase/thioredoxin